jgi:membrane-associated phospholipid phosphatase
MDPDLLVIILQLTMKQLLWTLPQNVFSCFKARMLVWHLIAFLLTLLLVTTGLDWRYFLATRSRILWAVMIPAAPIGALVPVALPLVLLASAGLKKNARMRLTGWTIAQSEIIGGVIAAGYKSITGRAHPEFAVGADLSHVFKFGLLRGGAFWGWPSSHTTIAFAMAATVFTAFPKHRWLGVTAFAYALYIGAGVSMTIHWLSDAAAGAIFGTVVGVVVGKHFLRMNPTNKELESIRSDEENRQKPL